MEKVMNLAALDPWIRLAEEWQYVLASLLALLASIILAFSITKAANTRAAASAAQPPLPQALDRPEPQASLSNDHLSSLGADTEDLRSLLRRAVSLLSDASTNQETVRSLCQHIAALQPEFRVLPGKSEPRTREAHVALLKQFKKLREVLEQEWSPPEALAVLIQMNADARVLSASQEQQQIGNVHELRNWKN